MLLTRLDVWSEGACPAPCPGEEAAVDLAARSSFKDAVELFKLLLYAFGIIEHRSADYPFGPY